jgi:hypothetical protein
MAVSPTKHPWGDVVTPVTTLLFLERTLIENSLRLDAAGKFGVIPVKVLPKNFTVCPTVVVSATVDNTTIGPTMLTTRVYGANDGCTTC